MSEATVLTAAQVTEALTGLTGWDGDADRIEATYRMSTFPVAIGLVDRVAASAEALDHHPDIDVRWRTVTFRLSTHSAGGVTAKDVELAGTIAEHAQALGWTGP
jgi:4a-hydroxytetrahydrobiopterin dehydratase